jgi:hypothetical protein
MERVWVWIPTWTKFDCLWKFQYDTRWCNVEYKEKSIAKMGDVIVLPQTKISSREFNEEGWLTGVANSRTHPVYGKVKSGWHDRRKSSLSPVASSSVWLLHCTLRNLIILRCVTWSFWSKILIGCSGYVKSTSSGATSSNTTSTGAFIHFFSCDTWKMSCTLAIDDGSSSLYTTFAH